MYHKKSIIERRRRHQVLQNVTVTRGMWIENKICITGCKIINNSKIKLYQSGRKSNFE